MTGNLCACGKPSRDAYVCTACSHTLDAAIAEVAEERGLAYDLDIALTRQARLGDRNGSRPTEKPVPYDGRASEAAADLARTLRKWAYRIKRDTGSGYPPRKLAPLAAWLRPRVGWLRYHPDGLTAYNEILDAVRQARRVIDRPADKLYAGPCDCGEDLYARLDAAYVVCSNTEHGEDGVAWEVEARRSWLLKSAEDVLATTTEISRALNRYAQPITPSAIRGYVARGRLFPKGEHVENGRAVPLYRLGDVLKLVAPEQEKASA